MPKPDRDGRGGADEGLDELKPLGGGGGSGNRDDWDQFPGAPDTLEEALGKKSRPMSTFNAVKNANPFYDGSFGEYSENCQRAVVATEARFRGYDVIAQPTYKDDSMPSDWKRAFKDPKTEKIGRTTAKATINAVEAQMKKYGNGSRAILSVQWKGRGASGHVINVVQRAGKTHYYDGQVGGVYNKEYLFNAIRTGNTELVRVDNLQFGDRAREAVRTTPRRRK